MGLRVKSQPTLAEELRAARIAADLSQADLAARMGVTARTVQYWEAGKTPYPQHRRRLREFIGFVNGEVAA